MATSAEAVDPARPARAERIARSGLRVHRPTLRVCVGLLLIGPTALAFFTGGYFGAPRAWAGGMAWTLAAGGAILVRGGIRRSDRPLLVALVGLALLTAWALLSGTWAPDRGGASRAVQIDTIYLGGLLAATLLLRDRSSQRLVEPALVAGAAVLIIYGLSDRWFPGVLHFARSADSQNRLEQPLTYWNALGEVAALGLVLSARMAGDVERSTLVRCAAVAAAVPLGCGLYLTFSRGAIFACAAGFLALIVASPRREQLRGLATCLGAAVLAALAVAPLRGVVSLSGTLSARERQGASALVLAVLIAALAAFVQYRQISSERTGPLRLPSGSALLATMVVCAGFAVLVVAGTAHPSSAATGSGVSRLAATQSARYAYWDVALRAFEAEPIRGVGAGGWATWWLRYRPAADNALDAHSLELQTLAELGVVGAGLLLMCFGGIASAARAAIRRAPTLAAGPVAGLVVYLVHTSLDWDWQMPAVTLVAVVLAGSLLSLRASDP